ncbi:MAG: YjiH family protein [Bacillota bacterium]
MEKDKVNNFEASFKDKLNFYLMSAVGILVFFIPITLNGEKTIPLDHIVTFIKTNFSTFSSYYALVVIILGGIYPFIKKTWDKSLFDRFMSVFKLFGIIVAFMAITKIGPKFLFEPDMIPFLYDKLAISVGLIVPIGAIFLAFLVGYGLLEFIGVLLKPIMNPIWNTPGRSAIDAVASFVGSYSIGLLITNKVYKEGKYSAKEASIIATGFSTVSATFMIIVAKTLGLMDKWNFYFWSTLFITFLITAITTRIYPLSKKSDEYATDEPIKEPEIEGNILKSAYNEGLKSASISDDLIKGIKENLIDGFKMAMSILPSILSVGLLGLILAKYTPIFKGIGYIFYPFTLIMKIPEPLLAAEACAIEIAEMFLPALLVTGASLLTKYVIGVVSVAAILFFSASIPCILSTDIPISIKDILIIWFERTVLAIILAASFGHLFL